MRRVDIFLYLFTQRCLYLFFQYDVYVWKITFTTPHWHVGNTVYVCHMGHNYGVFISCSNIVCQDPAVRNLTKLFNLRMRLL